jgi:anhydro-N-acetylmuramic acid kinase
MPEFYIGLMSGTSMDAVDAVLVDMDKNIPVLRHYHKVPVPGKLRAHLISVAQEENTTLNRLSELDVRLGRLFAETALDLLRQSGTSAEMVRAIGSHGQTIYHRPAGPFPTSLQIGDPNIIAERTGITTVADFRRRDMAAGGQGAPLVPAFHEAVFRLNDRNRVIVNIGGIANITILPANPLKKVGGFDTGPGNTLMDGWIKKQQRKNRDDCGRWAASGEVDEALLSKMLKDPYFRKTPPKSTGREYFNPAWLDKVLKRSKQRIPAKHVQATLCELTARSISDAIHEHAPQTHEVLVCGGGVHNLALMLRLQMLMGTIRVVSTEEFNTDPDYVEAIAFAWLAKQTLQGGAGNLPSVTGAGRAVVLGGIYPGRVESPGQRAK